MNEAFKLLFSVVSGLTGLIISYYILKIIGMPTGLNQFQYNVLQLSCWIFQIVFTIMFGVLGVIALNVIFKNNKSKVVSER